MDTRNSANTSSRLITTDGDHSCAAIGFISYARRDNPHNPSMPSFTFVTPDGNKVWKRIRHVIKQFCTRRFSISRRSRLRSFNLLAKYTSLLRILFIQKFNHLRGSSQSACSIDAWSDLKTDRRSCHPCCVDTRNLQKSTKTNRVLMSIL